MQFNFSDVWWLALILAIPAVTALYALYYRGRVALDRLKAFADAHLLPHLLKNKTAMQHSIAKPLIVWSIIWACGALAMAGPRWNYTDVQTGTPNRSLIILLDLSKSMDAQDVKPSRLERAKQEIGDIIDGSHATSIGLIAFAAIPHMVVPLTDDMATIRYLMPSLDTGLVGVQGSRLAPALEMAGLMLRTAPGKDKSILVVSDGGMVDLADATQTIPEGVHVYAMGMGTSEGAPIPRDRGGWIERRNGDVVIATLEADKLQAIANAGKGIYITADYSDSDTHSLLSHIEAGPETGTTKKGGRTVRIWDEKFYIPALVMALIMLPWFRRGYVFPVVLLMMFWPSPARADFGDLFMNQAQQARAAYDQRDYEGAAQKFDTPYRRGVSQYRAQQFDKAEQSFAQDTDPKTAVDSEYNKGNAQLMQGKADDAIASYEDVLKQRPGDQAATKNLEIAKKLREQQQKKNDQKDQKQDQKKDQQKDAKNDKKQDQKQDKQQDQKQQDKQQQAQNNQQQNNSGDQQQKDKQGQQQQKDQNGQKQQQDKQGEHQQTGQQQQADNGQQQDKQQQDQKQKGESSQNGQQGQQTQEQKGQNQDSQQQPQGSQDKDKQQQAQNGQGDQQGQQHNEQQQGEPDKGKGEQQAQNGESKDGNQNNQPQDQKGAADQKNAQNDQKSPPQPGSAEDKKNRAEHNGASEKQAQDQKAGGNDKDKQQAGQQGKKDDQKQAQDQTQQQAPQTPQDDKQKQQEQAAQQAQGNDKQKEQQAKAGGQEGKNEQPQNQQQPSYSQGGQDNSSAQQQQQQAYDSGQQTDGQSGSEHPGQVLNGQQRPRSQKDVDADQWLNRAVSDPGPFLRNQFDIDARKNPQPEEEDPW
ncbi:MAG TPA: VWA domain-containing protein [Patescibacteria group bacterium]|nr:VWA domain-containing protein [Patescibacteria group bacterium]